MKKKLLLLTVLVFALTCIFAISVSAAVTTYDDAPTRTKYTATLDDVVVFYDGFSCPTSYVFKDQSEIYNNAGQMAAAFDFEYINGKTGKTYTFADIKDLDLPEGITYIGSYAATKVTTLRRVTIPKTVTSMNQCVFQGATGLEELVFEHTAESNFKSFPNWTVQGCTSLKAFSMPDCITAMTGSTHFAGCTNLTALYLSKNLETMGEGKQGTNATFYKCEKMYFVDKPFTYDNIPQKPEVYSFPSKLTGLATTNIEKCETFKECKSLNDILVFPTGVTEIPDGWAFCNSNSIKVVFLGDMTRVSTTGNAWNNGGAITIYFCNPADKSDADITTSTSATRVYCNTDGNHLYKVATEKAPTCTEEGVKGYACFCGVASSEAEKIDALGHTAGTEILNKYFKANEDGSINYFANMVKVCACTVCSENAEFEIENTALFATDKGYSFSETDASSFSYTLHVNENAIKNYLAENAGFKYGVVVSANTTNKAPISIVDGAVNKNVAQTIIVELQGSTNVYEYVMTKLTFDAENQGKSLICQAYAVDGADNKVSYLGTDNTTINAEVISHAILVEKYESEEDLEKVA
ncbi:MAG: leucine-rich repeat protein [Clostridia bacterium]|nr:leucine-rich repeat protein [Clostridia bacterium]